MLVAVPNAQVISNVMSVAPHVLEPTVVSNILFSHLTEELLLEASLSGTLARLLNAAATSLIEGGIYPAFMGFLRHGIFFAMTVPEIEGAREVGPLVRYVGPFVDESRQLPDNDLDNWLSSHDDGVVLVSMGTILANEDHIGAVAAAVLRLASEDGEGSPAAGVGVLWAVQPHQRPYIPEHLAAELETHPRVRVQVVILYYLIHPCLNHQPALTLLLYSLVVVWPISYIIFIAHAATVTTAAAVQCSAVIFLGFSNACQIDSDLRLHDD